MIVDAVLHPSELPSLAKRGLSDAVCVVFDVLRATSSIITGLASGVREFLPAVSIEEALSLHKAHPEALLAGERQGDKIEGFDLGNSPMEYLTHGEASIITTTTNGTIALRSCAGAASVLVGAVLNLGALIRTIGALNPKRLLAVCAGTGSNIAIEDAWAAGALLTNFAAHDCSDAARIAIALRSTHPTASVPLHSSSNGRALLAKNRLADIEWCELEDRFQTVGVLENGAIRRWEACR